MLDQDLDTWTDPDAAGLQRCRLHDDVAPFRGIDGCAACLADPTPAEDTPRPGADVVRILTDTATLEADRAGLADMLELERRATDAIKVTRSELRTCRKIAATCEARAHAILDGQIEVIDREAEARKWFAEAVKYRMAAAKQVDTGAKLTKLALEPARERFRASRFATRALLIGKGRGSAH